MKNDDIRAMFVFQADISGQDYDKIINYFQKKGISVEYPGFIGKHSSLAVLGWRIPDFDTSNIVPTNAEKALAKEIGVSANSLSRFTEYFNQYVDIIWDSNYKVEEIYEFLDTGIYSTMSKGREAADYICDKLNIKYDKAEKIEEGKNNYIEGIIEGDTKYEDYNLKISIIEAHDEKLYIRVIDRGVINIPVETENKEEFISEFKESIEKFVAVYDEISPEQADRIAKNVSIHIKMENMLLKGKDLHDKNEYLEEKKEIETKIKLSEIFVNHPILGKAFDGKIDELQKELSEVDSKLNKLILKEAEIATEEMGKYTELRDKYLEKLEALNNWGNTIKEYDNKAWDVYYNHKESILEYIDEYEDRISVCQKAIDAAKNIETVEEVVSTADIVSNNIEAETNTFIENTEKLINNTIEKTKEELGNLIIGVDNAAGDIFDKASDIATQTNNSEISEMAEKFYSKVENILSDIKEIANDFANNLPESFESFASAAKEINEKLSEIIKEDVQGLAENCGIEKEADDKDFDSVIENN